MPKAVDDTSRHPSFLPSGSFPLGRAGCTPAFDQPNILHFAGLRDILAGTQHPDSGLMVAIERYEILLDQRNHFYALAGRYKEGGRRNTELYCKAFEKNDERQKLETTISETPAQTAIGLVNKVQLALRCIDPEGSGRRRTLYQVPISALNEALALLEAQQ